MIADEEPTGIVTAYLNKYIQAFDELPHEDFAKFIRHRIRDDFDRPLYYLLRVWLMWVCDGPPRNCGDVLRKQIAPRLNLNWEDPGRQVRIAKGGSISVERGVHTTF